MVNQTFSSTNASTDLTQENGYCDPWTLWAIMPLIAALVLVVMVVVIGRIAKMGPSGHGVNYGRPWMVIHLLLSIGVWSLLPPSLLFLFYFHLWTTDEWSALETVSRVACLQLYENFPFIPTVFVTQGLLILVVYSPATFVKTSAALLLPEDAIDRVASKMTARQAHHRPTVLVVGGTSRGLVYLEILKRVLDRYTEKLLPQQSQLAKPRVVLMDLDATRDWVVHNAEALNMTAHTEIIGMGSARNHRAVAGSMMTEELIPVRDKQAAEAPNTTPRDAFALDITVRRSDEATYVFPTIRDNEVDEVVLSSYLRRMRPIGDFITPPSEIKKRVITLLAEVRRVLRPGGTVRVCDGLLEVLSFEAELHEAGFDITTPTVCTGHKVGAVFFRQAYQYGCEATKPPAPDASEWDRGTTLTMSVALPLLELSEHRTEGLASVPSGPSTPLSPAREPKDTTISTAKIAIPLCFFVTLVLFASVLAGPLWLPTNVEPSIRVSMFVMGVATSYPMFAYLSHLGDAPATRSVSWITLSKREVKAIAGSAVMSCVTYLPQLLLQEILASTGVSSSLRSTIATVISVAIAVLGYKLFNRQRLNAALAASNCSNERYLALLRAPEAK